MSPDLPPWHPDGKITDAAKKRRKKKAEVSCFCETSRLPDALMFAELQPGADRPVAV